MSTGTFDSNVDTTPAVSAVSTNGADGIDATSDSGTGVVGNSTAGTGVLGSGPIGVRGNSESGTGVLGQSNSDSSSNAGVKGVNGSISGLGVWGVGTTGVLGSGGSMGVIGSGNSIGVRGDSPSGTGALGVSTVGVGVFGSSHSGPAVIGGSGSGTGVFGSSNSGLAGDFRGNVQVSGALMKKGGGFQIDHPLDPAHKSLSHSFVESPEMKNLYDGVVVLDANGEAEVELPSWFEALNTQFRYQLTPIVASAPELYIAEKIQGNRFRIAGGKPAMEVSWQVTGIRQDAWAKAHRIPVVQDKPAQEQGHYRHPDLYGEPEEKSLLRARYPGLKTPVPPEQ